MENNQGWFTCSDGFFFTCKDQRYDIPSLELQETLLSCIKNVFVEALTLPP